MKPAASSTSRPDLPEQGLHALLHPLWLGIQRGYILVGIGIMGADILPDMGGLLLAIGAPAFGPGAMFGKIQVYIRTIGITLMGVALIWLGVSML